MLKLVGTSHGEVADEKVILTDDNKLTGFGWKLIILDILLDISIFITISKIVKLVKVIKTQMNK